MIRDVEALLYRNGITTRPPEDGCRWLTREEAVRLLKDWRDRIPKYNLDFSPRIVHGYFTSGLTYVYKTSLVDMLIEKILNGKDDPITEVARCYYRFDEVLALSDDDHFVTHRFAGYMERTAHELLNYLREKEKELIQNENR